jgi:hypothetical protein
MPSTTTLKATAQAVVTLRAASPQGWTKFLEVLRARSAEIDSELVNSPPDYLKKNQGRAAEMRALLLELEGAIIMAEKLYEKERQNGHAART